jgi:putative endonuclease
MKAKDALGAMGESLACDHLTAIGYTIVDRNWRCEFGEIDIVARHESTLIVCEVKTRSSLRHGDPVEAVSARKVRRLRRLAMCWLEAHAIHAPHIRIDVIGVLRCHDGPTSLRHITGVE